MTLLIGLALLQSTLTIPWLESASQPKPAAQASTVSADCVGQLCDGARLRPFFDALARSAATRRPVRILQIGDSHTAADQVTGSWRSLLQARYGSAGRGMLAPGRPYAGYLTRGITASQSAGWTVNGIFGPAYAGSGAPPIGVSGYSQTAATIGASMALKAEANELFDRFTVCAMTGPGQGAVTLTIASTRVEWALDSEVRLPACRTVATDATTDSAAVAVERGPVTLTSWTTERAGAGVELSNLGTVGAQLIHASRADDAVVAAEIQAYAPDLIVVAFGTNEAFRPGFSASDYEATLQAGLRRIHGFAPAVPMLVIGAPDSATTQPGLQSGAAGTSASCVSPLAGAWRPTAALPLVQSIQRRRAHAMGAAFWDWGAAMGGRCTAVDWATRTPPLMRGDRVHFTKPGAAEIARLLQQDLDAAAARYAPAEPR